MRRGSYNERSGGFDKGRRLIRLPAIGLPPGMPASARYEPPRGFPCQIRRGPGRMDAKRGPHSYSLSRQPTGARRRRCGSASGSCGERAELAARAARRAALKPYRKFSQTPERYPVRYPCAVSSGAYAPVGWLSSTRRTSAKLRTREARTALPLSAEASDGRPMTPEVV